MNKYAQQTHEQMGYTCIPPEKEQPLAENTALHKAFISSKIDYALEEKCDASDYADTILPTSVTYGENEEEYKLHKIIEAAFIAGQKKKQKPTTEEVLMRAGLKPFKDGNQWCVLAGDNIQEGVCGFGDTIEDALIEFLKDVRKQNKPSEEQPIGEEYAIEIGKDVHTLRVGSQSDINRLIAQDRQEQPEVDIVTEYDTQFYSDPAYGKLANRNAGIAIARHFYELGLNARKEDTK